MSSKHMTDKLLFGKSVLKKIDKQGLIKTWGANNSGGVLAETALTLAKNTDVFTSDNYNAKWSYDLSAEAVLAAKGRGGDLGFMNITTWWYGGANSDPAEHARYAYAALGRGARMLAWWTWHYRDALELQPERFSVIAKVNEEVGKIGPVLNQHTRVKAKIAMLVPCGTEDVLVGLSRHRQFQLAQNLLKTLQPVCGNLDYLLPKQIHDGRLGEYKSMFIAGEKLLGDANWLRIEKWVNAGHILVLFGDAASLNTRQEPSKIYRRLFSQGKIEDESVVKLGKGEIIRIASLPGNTRAMRALLEKYGIDGCVASSSEAQISPYLFSSTQNSSYCLVLVNTGNTSVKSDVLLDLPEGYHAYSLRTGKSTFCHAAGNGKARLSIRLGKYWGDAILLTSGIVGGLAVSLDDVFTRGKTFSFKIKLLGEDEKALDAAAPVNISIYDSLGKFRKEYSGYHVFKNGVYSENLMLPVNEPVGKWRIEAKCPLGGQSLTKEFVIK
jgi:hypothetical protein